MQGGGSCVLPWQHRREREYLEDVPVPLHAPPLTCKRARPQVRGLVARGFNSPLAHRVISVEIQKGPNPQGSVLSVSRDG